jgi:hypothetical protein
MHALHAIPRMCLKLLGSLQRPQFQCGQCDRWQQCGRPPSESCITRAIQIARNAERPIPRAMLPHRRGFGA